MLLAAVIGVVLLAYANSLHAPFLLDNADVVLKDTRIRAVTAEHLRRILSGQYWEVSNVGLYRPLTTLSFLLNYAVFGNGTEPDGYHWFNFALHALNVVLVYALGLAVFGRMRLALLVAALWGLHPVLTESVTNIVGRSDMMAAFSVLAALLCHRQAQTAQGARKSGWLAAIGLAAGIGIFSKESAIVVVGVFAVYDVTFARAASWRARIPSYAAAAIPALIYLYLRHLAIAGTSQLGPPMGENALLGHQFWTQRMTAVKVLGRYFALLVWPARLSWDYGYNEVPLFGWHLGSTEDWKAIAALAGCAAAAVLAVRSWRTRKPVFFAIAFFFVAISPVSNLVVVIGAVMAERFLYLPSVGFAIVAAWAVDSLLGRIPPGRRAFRSVAFAALSVWLIALAARTYGRNADWLDPERFWLSAAAAAPDSYQTNVAAAVDTVVVTQADVARSVYYANRALHILSGLPESRSSPTGYRFLGIFFRDLGDRWTSLKAAGKTPAGPDAQYWYRKSLAELSRSERIEVAHDARYRARNARRGMPGLTSLPSSLYLALGTTYLRLADTPHALAALERGRALESSPDLLTELASLYRETGEPHKAALALVEALAVAPNRSDLASQLVELYGQIDPKGCAVTRQGGAASLNPDCPLVHGDICAASRNVIGNYLRRGQQYEAASIRNVAAQDLGCEARLLN